VLAKTRPVRTVEWETLYSDNVTWVFRLMLGRVGNLPDAEDLTAEVFLTALPYLRTGADVEQVRAYLRATARTVLARHWRSAFSTEAAALELAKTVDATTENAPVGTATQQAELILDALPDPYRSVLRLRYLHAYSLKETASELGITLSNAKVIQHRALKLAASLGGR
jgi:RNA polymerase sigma factor (sigma-70 family)